MWLIHLESVKHDLNGDSGRQNAIVNVSNFRFLLRYEVIWKEWVAVHQKDVCFLLILFYWPFPVINLRIAKNTWYNGWLLFKALIYFTAQSLWESALATLALLYCLEKECSPCVLLQKSSVVFQCMHINSSCHYAWILSQQFPLMKPSPGPVTFICTDQHHRARNAISSQTLSANHRTVGHEWPSAFSFLIGSELGLPAWLFCASITHLKNGHNFIFPPCWRHFEGECTHEWDLLRFFDVCWKIGVFVLFLF